MRFPITPAEFLVLSNEDMDAFNEMRAAIHAQYCAANPTELFLVEELVQNAWRIRRFRHFEANAFQCTGNEIRANMREVAFYQRCLAAAERAYHRALTALTKLQRERTREAKQTNAFIPSNSAQPDRSAENGFVPQKKEAPAAQTLDWDQAFDRERFQVDKQKWFARRQNGSARTHSTA